MPMYMRIRNGRVTISTGASRAYLAALSIFLPAESSETRSDGVARVARKSLMGCILILLPSGVITGSSFQRIRPGLQFLPARSTLVTRPRTTQPCGRIVRSPALRGRSNRNEITSPTRAPAESKGVVSDSSSTWPRSSLAAFGSSPTSSACPESVRGMIRSKQNATSLFTLNLHECCLCTVGTRCWNTLENVATLQATADTATQPQHSARLGDRRSLRRRRSSRFYSGGLAGHGSRRQACTP